MLAWALALACGISGCRLDSPIYNGYFKEELNEASFFLVVACGLDHGSPGRWKTYLRFHMKKLHDTRVHGSVAWSVSKKISQERDWGRQSCAWGVGLLTREKGRFLVSVSERWSLDGLYQIMVYQSTSQDSSSCKWQKPSQIGIREGENHWLIITEKSEKIQNRMLFHQHLWMDWLSVLPIFLFLSPFWFSFSYPFCLWAVSL